MKFFTRANISDCSETWTEPLSPTTEWCNGLITLLLICFASFTILFHAGIFLHWSLNVLVTVWIVLLLFGLGLIAYGSYITFRNTSIRFSAIESPAAALLLLSFIGAALGMLSCRPDADDVVYMAPAVWSYAHNTESMALIYPFAHFPSVNIILPWRITSYEHFCASLAMITGLAPVEIYHHAMSALGGILIPMVWFITLRRFVSDDWSALAGVVAVVLLLCLDGTAHRSPGNFAFVRIWQGKAILMTIATPVCISFLLDGFSKLTWITGLRLVLISVAGIGLHLMSLFYLPVLFGVMGVAYYVTNLRCSKLRNIVSVGLLLGCYLALWAGYVFCFMSKFLVGSSSEAGWPVSLPEITLFVFGSFHGISIVAGASAIGILLLLRKYRSATFLMAWTAVIVVPLAIPPVSKTIATYITSRNAFWRILYLLPILPAVGLATAELQQRFKHHRAIFWIVCLLIASFVAAAAVFDISPSPWASPNVNFPVFRLKFNATDLSESRAIINKLEPGTMLAARPVSIIIPVLTTDLKVGDQRGMSCDGVALLAGQPELGELRNQAHAFISGLNNSHEAFKAFVNQLKFPFRYLVIEADTTRQRRVTEALSSAGYMRRNIGLKNLRVYELRQQ